MGYRLLQIFNQRLSPDRWKESQRRQHKGKLDLSSWACHTTMPMLRWPLSSSPPLARRQPPRLSKVHAKCWLLHTPEEGRPAGGAHNTFSKTTSFSELFSDKIGEVTPSLPKLKAEERQETHTERGGGGGEWTGVGPGWGQGEVGHTENEKHSYKLPANI